MAGSGELSRAGNTAALNAALGCSITGAGVNPPGRWIGALSVTLATGVATTLTCAAATGGAVLTQAIPDDSVIIVADAAGAVDTMELFTVNGAQAVGAGSITFDSQTVRTSHPNGSGIWLVAWKHYLALFLSSGSPGDNALGTEYAQTGYARQALNWVAPTAADPPVAVTNAILTFGPLSGANGTDIVSFAADRDSLSGPAGAVAGNMGAWWTFGATRTPNAGDSLQIAAAALSMQNYH